MLLQAKGVQDSATAAVRVSGLELGGLAGSLSAGFLSDKLVAKASESGAGMVGARVKVLLDPTTMVLSGFPSNMLCCELQMQHRVEAPGSFSGAFTYNGSPDVIYHATGQLPISGRQSLS